MECSGRHRGLGVHLSFVRSISMDKWKDNELAKMKVGGNAKAKAFFNSQPDWDWNQPLTVRYNSKAAALYRDKIATESQGKDWSIETSAAKDYASSRVSGSSSQPAASMHKSASTGHFKSPAAASSANSEWQESEWSSYQNSNESSFINSNTVKTQRDEFFSRRTAENASRPDDLPPSQGGKYAGFGSSSYASGGPTRSQSTNVFPSTDFNSSAWMSAFSQLASKATESAVKISSIATQKATEIAGTVNEKVKKELDVVFHGTLLSFHPRFLFLFLFSVQTLR